jgi:hypothetical protein
MSVRRFGWAARTRAAWVRRLALMSLVAVLAALVGAQTAAAGLQKEFAAFANCPVENPATLQCVVSTTTSGEFKIGKKQVPVNKPVILQGGITKEGQLVPAVGGETLSRTALEVPGGIVGIEILGPLTGVTATAELAGTVELNPTNTNTGKGTAAVLPLKVKLDNALLGPACYIGSEAEPLTPHLTTGTTNPPEGVAPIKGSTGTPSIEGHGKIVTLKNSSLVDNAFAAPGLNGCAGILAPIVDPAADLAVGLPAKAGENVAVLTGNLAVASAHNVVAQRTLPELGRCVKLKGEKVGKEVLFHGGFRAADCVEEDPAKGGQYEFLPGPGELKKFVSKTGVVTLETVGGKKVKCAASTGSGEYTGAKSATTSITLTGCKTSSGGCHTAGAAEGEVSAPGLQATLGFIENAVVSGEFHLALGWDLAHPGQLASAECGAAKEALVLTGSVIGKIEPIDKSVLAYNTKFTQATGKQTPASFEEAPTDTISASFAGTPEAAGLSTTDHITNEEKLLFKAEQEE